MIKKTFIVFIFILLVGSLMVVAQEDYGTLDELVGDLVLGEDVTFYLLPDDRTFVVDTFGIVYQVNTETRALTKTTRKEEDFLGLDFTSRKYTTDGWVDEKEVDEETKTLLEEAAPRETITVEADIDPENVKDSAALDALAEQSGYGIDTNALIGDLYETQPELFDNNGVLKAGVVIDLDKLRVLQREKGIQLTRSISIQEEITESDKVLRSLARGETTHSEAYDQLDKLATTAENKAGTEDVQEVLRLSKEWDKAEAKFLSAKEGSEEETRAKAEFDRINSELRKAVEEGDITVEEAEELERRSKELRRKAQSVRWKGSWVENLGLSKDDYCKNRRLSGSACSSAYNEYSEDKPYTKIKDTLKDVGAYAQFAQRLGSYRALSNLLLPGLTQDFISFANNEFFNTMSNLPQLAAPVVGRLIPGVEMCKIDDRNRAEIPGSSSAYVQTPGGSFQFVGAINAEKSPQQTPILCNPNPDLEGAEPFVCKGDLICKEDGFCYEDEDSSIPAQGTFYKIVWGVSAPVDEEFTPFIDENGKAVKFNLQLDDRIWLFRRGGKADDTIIELNNGGRDGGTIVHFSEKDYGKVCIQFNDRYKVKDYFGSDVPEICATFEDSSKGKLEFESSERTASVPSTDEEVSEVTDW